MTKKSKDNKIISPLVENDKEIDYKAEYEKYRMLYNEYKQRISEYKERFDSSIDTIRELREANEKLKKDYNTVVNSRSYKIVKLYYSISDVILPLGSRRREFIKKLLYPVLFLFKKNKKGISFEGGFNSKSPEEAFNELKYSGRIDIITTYHTGYIAKHLQSILKKLEIDCEIHYGEVEKYSDIPYIIICPQFLKKFPSVYVVFQMEQTITPRWMTEEYFEILRNAYAVFDYSLINIDYFRKDSSLASKLFYLPVDYCANLEGASDGNVEKEYDVLFYGAPFVERRKNILDKLGAKFNVKIHSDLFGDALYKEIAKARVVINIHYYEDAMLETTRLYETLSVNGPIIVSERSCDQREEERLEGIVDFVEVGDLDAIINRVTYWLEHDEERQEKVKANAELLCSRANATEFYFHRFLLANERIPFDLFYKNVGEFVKIPENGRMCLNLPESTDRAQAFNKDNKYGFVTFPGLRHRAGWIGCALSYKFIMKRASDLKLQRLLVCEDDVYFPDEFDERFQKVLNFLDQNNDWDVFCGVMADLNNTKILDLKEQDGETFAYLSKMVSMVFNIYNKSVFDVIVGWDSTNHDVNKNTIDRYLEHVKLGIVTTAPFLVGHKEDLTSTIWGQQNTMYNEFLEKSSKRITQLVEGFKQKNNK